MRVKSKQIVIIGAGSAGLSAAETLRKTGYKGYIYLVTKEADLTIAPCLASTWTPQSLLSHPQPAIRPIIPGTKKAVGSAEDDYFKFIN